MNLLGRDFSAAAVLSRISSKLAERGLQFGDAVTPETPGVERRVDPLSFVMRALTDNVDPTEGLPIETHRAGLAGRLVVGAKTVFRRTFQIFINETLARQHHFNGHVRDAYAQLSAEVIRLRQRVAELEGRRVDSVQATARPTATAPVPTVKSAKKRPVKKQAGAKPESAVRLVKPKSVARLKPVAVKPAARRAPVRSQKRANTRRHS